MNQWLGTTSRITRTGTIALLCASSPTTVQAQVDAHDEESATAASMEPTLDPASLDGWLQYIQPDEEDLSAFRNIRWRETLEQGINDAQIEGKPVLLWAMNGHPMGCT